MKLTVLTNPDGSLEIWRNVEKMCGAHEIPRSTIYNNINKGPMEYKGYKITKVVVGVTFPDNLKLRNA
jgi:hypothetical protein